MKKSMKFLSLLAAVAFLASCSYTRPAGLTQNSTGSKVGMASGTCYLFILCFNADWSLRTAAQNGGIKKIATVDYKQSNILNIVFTHETIVTGE